MIYEYQNFSVPSGSDFIEFLNRKGLSGWRYIAHATHPNGSSTVMMERSA